MSRPFFKIVSKGSTANFSNTFHPLTCSSRCYNKGNFRKFHTCRLTFQTMRDIVKILDTWMGSQGSFSEHPPDRSHLLKYLPTSQDELPTRSMKDSYATAVIPLSSSPYLQYRYATVNGKLRIGRIMEDMDYFAVYIALKHIENPKWHEGLPSPYTIVTAAIDEMEITYEKPSVTEDVRISGKVVNTGKSSMDVLVNLDKKVKVGWEKVTSANFVMAARDPTLSRAAVINKLVPDGPEEEKENREVLVRKARKKQDHKDSLLFNPPSIEEQQLIHNIFMKSVDINDQGLNKRILPPDSVWMEDSGLSSCFFPHPENRNHHNTVFGGYIVRLALQLAWMTAYKYSSSKPSLRYVTNITFKRSVSLSQFMQIKSQVIYTEGNFMQIVIFIELMDIQTKTVRTTHSLYTTYEIEKPVISVVPKTYHDAMLWLDGYREFRKQTKIKGIGY